MTIAYLNGEFLPLDEAKISPLDRGFLFGDGIYEVVPSYNGKAVGLSLHIERLFSGLANINIENKKTKSEWLNLVDSLIVQNQTELGENIAVYIHVSRGADTHRYHGFPSNVEPTIFAFAFALSSPVSANKNEVKGISCGLTQDLRWQRCHIKSTALLGNVLHFQQAKDYQHTEMILHNADDQITEASSSNVFTVTGNVIRTPKLDHQLLPGITRHIVLDILRQEARYRVEETNISVEDLLNADEVWITSSGKEIMPVVQVMDHVINDGSVGSVWEHAMSLYSIHKFDY